MDRPNPEGWQGGSEDFGVVRTFDGHRTINEAQAPGPLERHDFTANVRRGDDMNIGGDYDS